MIRLVALLIGLSFLCTAIPARAQPAAPASPAAPAALTAAQAQAAIDVLNDPKQRAALAAALAAIAEAPATHPAQPGAAAPPTAPAPQQPAGSPQPAAAASPPAAAPPPAKLAIPLAPNSLGAQILLSASDFLRHSSQRVVHTVRAAAGLPQFWHWFVLVTTDPWARSFVLDALWRLAVALILAASLQFALRRAVRRPMAALESWAPATDSAADTGDGTATDAAAAPAGDARGDADDAPEAPPPVAVAQVGPAGEADPVARPGTERDPSDETDDETSVETSVETSEARAEAGDTESPPRARRRGPSASIMLHRLPLVLARLMLDLVPIIGFGVVGHLVAGSGLGGTQSSRLILLAVIDAYLACAVVMAVARMMFSPGKSRLRLFQIPDSLAAWVMRWCRRIAVVTVFGYAGAEVGSLLGLSGDARSALLKVISLVAHVFVAIMVLEKRRAVARLIRGQPDAGGTMARTRRALAAVWHWIAVVLIIALWVVWAVEVPDGFAWLLRFTLVTGALLIGARLLYILLTGLVDRTLGVPIERFPGLQERLHVYHPVVNGFLCFGVYALTLLALLQVYGLKGLTWFFNSELGERIAGAFCTIAVTFLLAVAVWEVANVAIDRHLSKLAKDQQAARSARLRTLLPLLRSALAIVIIVFAGLTVLSEIGINIAPLLAGAGIIGVAIGFGSQKLVQDLINGIFLLLENAMQVGDLVTVSGLQGTVEALSVRTIRLRAGDGSVHVIPFSAVTSVTNVNRGLGNASVNVVVDATEDTDRVAATLVEIVAGMRRDPDLAGKMLGDLQLWGVDKVDGACTTIAGQVVCTDAGRWSVQREFNRRMKKRFQELGIRLHNPLGTILITPPAPAPAQVSPPVEEHPRERSRAAE